MIPYDSSHEKRSYHLIAARLHVTKGVALEKTKLSDQELHFNVLNLITQYEGYIQTRKRVVDNVRWVFGDSRECEIEAHKVIFGRFGRVRTDRKQDIYDYEKRSFSIADTGNPINLGSSYGYANFLVDASQRAIIFEERDPYVSLNQFLRYFKKSYESFIGDYPSLELTLLSSWQNILTFMSNLDHIYLVKTVLYPPNPNLYGDFRTLGEELKKMEASKAALTFQSDKGLLTEDTLANQAVALAVNGYGTAEVQGLMKGEPKSTKSGKNTVVREDVIDEQDSPTTLLPKFFRKLKQIIERSR